MMGIILYGSYRPNQNTNYRKKDHGEYIIYLYINFLLNNTRNLYYI